MDEGTSRPDLGVVETSPRPPRADLTPCPDGWSEVALGENLKACEPWPGSSPVQWICPEGWSEVTVDDLRQCQPPAEWDPVRWTCPEGWYNRPTAGGSHSCRPYDAEGPRRCASAFEAHFPGEAACTAIGTVCPEGNFPQDLPADAPLVYVRPGGTGDGSTPEGALGSLDEIDFARLPANAVVVLGKGEYRGRLALTRSVTFIGACPAETILRDPSASSTPAVVDIRSAGIRGPTVELRNLRISENAGVGVQVLGRTQVKLDGVIIESAQGFGIVVNDGATADLETTIVRDTRGLADGSLGFGLQVLNRATARVRRSIFAGNRSIGVQARDQGSDLLLEDVVIRGTLAERSSGLGGYGLAVGLGAKTVAHRILLERNRTIAVWIRDDGTELEMADAVVRDTQGAGNGPDVGRGIEVQIGARAVVQRGLFEGNRGIGAAAFRNGSDLLLEDVIIRQTQGRNALGSAGRGVAAQEGGQIVIRRAVVEENAGTEIYAANPGSSLVAEDCLIRDTEENPIAARGVAVQFGGNVTLRRSMISGHGEAGIFAGSLDSKLVLEDMVVRDQVNGIGLAVRDGCPTQVRRTVFANNHRAGVLVSDPETDLLMEDVVVRDTQSDEATETLGRGMEVQLGAKVTLRRAVFQRNQEAGIIATDTGTHLIAEELVVRDTSGFGPNFVDGRGLSVQEGARASVTSALFQGNRFMGIYVASSGSELVLEDAVVRDTESNNLDDRFGRGLGVQFGGSAEVRRSWFSSNKEFGLIAQSSGRLTGSDLIVQNTSPPRCVANAGCVYNASAICSASGSTVTISRAVLDGSDQCGIYVTSDEDGTPSRFLLSEAVVSNNDVGACIRADGFDPSDIGDPTVDYRDNNQSIEFVTLPVPQPATPLSRSNE